MAMTDIDGDGQVSWQEFVPTAYDILVDVARGMRVRKGSAAGARSTPAATPLRACVRARARQLPDAGHVERPRVGGPAQRERWRRSGGGRSSR